MAAVYCNHAYTNIRAGTWIHHLCYLTYHWQCLMISLTGSKPAARWWAALIWWSCHSHRWRCWHDWSNDWWVCRLFLHYLLNIWEFVYLVYGLSPPNRRNIRLRNFCTQTRDDHLQDICWVLCLGVVVTKIMTFFYKMCACRPSSQCTQGLCITINSTGLAAAWADSDVAGVLQSDWPCMFTNIGRWPKRAGCMQLPRANQATKSIRNGPTGHNSLLTISEILV